MLAHVSKCHFLNNIRISADYMKCAEEWFRRWTEDPGVWCSIPDHVQKPLANIESTPPLIIQQHWEPSGTKIDVCITSAAENELHSPKFICHCDREIPFLGITMAYTARNIQEYLGCKYAFMTWIFHQRIHLAEIVTLIVNRNNSFQLSTYIHTIHIAAMNYFKDLIRLLLYQQRIIKSSLYRDSQRGKPVSRLSRNKDYSGHKEFG